MKKALFFGIILLILCFTTACTNTQQKVPFTTRLEPTRTAPEVKPGSTLTKPIVPASQVNQSLPDPTASQLPEPTTSQLDQETPAIEVPTSTPTPTSSPTKPLRMAVIGDYGSGDANAAQVAELVLSWQPDLILTVGDNNYPSGSAATIDENIGQFYHAYIYKYQGQYGAGSDTLRFLPTLGNHDWDTDRAQAYLDYFELPGNERYYDIVLHPVHIFALDSDSREPDGVSRKSVQAEWLREKLTSSNSPWKIVIMHHPPYSSGPRGAVDWMRWPFQDWGATILLAGHDHFYERLDIDGMPIIINGLGGGAIYAFGATTPGSQVRYNAEYGAQLITAEEDQLTFEFYNIKGEQIDVYQIFR